MTTERSPDGGVRTSEVFPNAGQGPASGIQLGCLGQRGSVQSALFPHRDVVAKKSGPHGCPTHAMSLRQLRHGDTSFVGGDDLRDQSAWEVPLALSRTADWLPVWHLEERATVGQ